MTSSSLRSRRRALTLASLVLVGAGALAARTVAPGVRVEPGSFTTRAGRRIAALRFRPEHPLPGRAPTAVLVHGVTTSKETLFVLAEGLAAAGFDALAIDLPGHGRSPGPFGRGDDLVDAVESGARAIAPGARVHPALDVLVGHSLGANVGALAIEEGRLEPRLFVVLGARPRPPAGAARTLYLVGAHDELLSPEELAPFVREPLVRLVVSRGSDHAIEPWDPALVRAALEAASETVGRTAPPPPGTWRVRLAGAAAVALGALGVLAFAPPRGPLGARRGALAGAAGALLGIAALVLGTGPAWLGASFSPPRIPQQIALALGAALASLVAGAVAGRIRVLAPARATWGQLGLALGAVLLASFEAETGASFAALVLALFAGLVVAASLTGLLVARRTRDAASAHAAFAILLGYALGQWLPLAW